MLLPAEGLICHCENDLLNRVFATRDRRATEAPSRGTVYSLSLRQATGLPRRCMWRGYRWHAGRGGPAMVPATSWNMVNPGFGYGCLLGCRSAGWYWSRAARLRHRVTGRARG